MTDKETIDKFKMLFTEATPAARKAIVTLLMPPTAPRPRSMKIEDLKGVQSRPIVTTVTTQPVFDEPIRPIITTDDEWWKQEPIDG